MQPQIHVFGISIKTFGICFAAGFVAAGLLVARRLKELGKPVDWAYELVFAALLGGLVGARAYFLIQNYDSVKHDLFGNIFGGSGLVWYGGAIGGAIGVLLWAHWRKMLNLTLLDMCAAPLAIGYAIGRIGCQVSGDGDYGIAWNGPWAMAYPHGTVPTTTRVHPTPIYETLAMGLLAWALWVLRDRYRPGVIFGIYLVGAGVERFLVEFIRRNNAVLAGLTAPQVESLVMAIAGSIWLWVLARRRGGWSPQVVTA
jgi:phosphatidylglycerol---prolipoprotein diacylglyceryl transferase